MAAEAWRFCPQREGLHDSERLRRRRQGRRARSVRSTPSWVAVLSPLAGTSASPRSADSPSDHRRFWVGSRATILRLSITGPQSSRNRPCRRDGGTKLTLSLRPSSSKLPEACGLDRSSPPQMVATLLFGEARIDAPAASGLELSDLAVVVLSVCRNYRAQLALRYTPADTPRSEPAQGVTYRPRIAFRLPASP
jgi:hypothetical protein